MARGVISRHVENKYGQEGLDKLNAPQKEAEQNTSQGQDDEPNRAADKLKPSTGPSQDNDGPHL